MMARAIILALSVSALAFADPPATRFSGIDLSSHGATVIVAGRYGLWVDGSTRLRYDNGSASHYVLTLSTASSTGDLFYASSSNVLGRLADVGAGAYLRSGGTGAAPLWSTLTLPNAATTGDLLYANATNAIGRLTAATSNQVLISNGVGVAPSWAAIPNGALPAVGTAATYTWSDGSMTTDAQGRVSSVTASVRNVNTTAPVTGGGALSADLTLACATCVTGALTSGRVPFASGTQALTDSSTFTFSGSTLTVTNLTANASLKGQRLLNQSAAPTIAVGSGGQLGASPSATITGGDIGGNLTLTTGTGPSAFVAATAVTLGTGTFNTTYSVAPKSGVPVPCNASAAALSTGANSVRVYIDQAITTTTQFTVKMISSGTPTLAASTAYQYCFLFVQ